MCYAGNSINILTGKKKKKIVEGNLLFNALG